LQRASLKAEALSTALSFPPFFPLQVLLLVCASHVVGRLLGGWSRTLMRTVLADIGGDCAPVLPRLPPSLLTPLWFGVFPFWLAANTLLLSFVCPLLGVIAWTLCLALLGVLALVDARTGILPNEVTLPLLLLGLAWQAWQAEGLPSDDYLWGAVLGYAVPRLLNTVGHWITGGDVLGQGDAKLLSGMGAWLGISALPQVWVVASFAVLVYTAYRRVRRWADVVSGSDVQCKLNYVPFGPFLVFGMNFLLVVSHV